jgi:2-succinyl-6-hydroxy-2,4-cyclohexadiene-1-carboxylate synthase
MRAFIHGFAQSPRMFDAVASPEDARPALPGHAPGVPADPGAGFWGAVDRIADGLAPRSDLIGYSLGGRIGLGVAIHRPDRVGRLTLIGASPGLETVAEREERRAADRRWIEILEAEGIAAFEAAWRAQPIFASQARLSPEVLELQRSIVLGHDPGQLAGALRQMGLGEMPSLWSRLHEIAVEVVLLTGAHDARFSEIARRMQANLRSARHVEIAGAGHNPILEAPDRIARLMTDR